MTFKYSPNNSKNMADGGTRLDINNIFAFNRLGTSTSVEGGASLTYGIDYSKSDKSDNEIIGLKIASIFREKNQVKLVGAGQECGITLKDFNDYQKKDIIEAFSSTSTERMI